MKKTSRRAVFTALALVFALLLTTTLAGCAGRFERQRSGDLTVYVNYPAKECFAAEYVYNGENGEITIPDEFEGVKITRLGGYDAKGSEAPFTVNLKDKLANVSEHEYYDYMYTNYIAPEPVSGTDAIFDDLTVSDSDIIIINGDIIFMDASNCAVPVNHEDVVITLNIGRNIREVISVGDTFAPCINDDGSVTVYRPVYKVNCAPESKFFYSENGKLYNKATGALVEAFDYAE